jgi:hypothetical protein
MSIGEDHTFVFGVGTSTLEVTYQDTMYVINR